MTKTNNAISYRIREAEAMAKDDGITPLEFAERAVKYWSAELDRRAKGGMPDDDARWMIAEWRKVVDYFGKR